jgi:hypothetical protein
MMTVDAAGRRLFGWTGGGVKGQAGQTSREPSGNSGGCSRLDWERFPSSTAIFLAAIGDKSALSMAAGG